MKVKIELFGAARDFSEQNLLEFDLDFDCFLLGGFFATFNYLL